MKRYPLLRLLAAVLTAAGCSAAYGQMDSPCGLMDSARVTRHDGCVEVRFTVDARRTPLTADDRLILTPVIVSGDGRTAALPSVEVVGRIRDKVDRRLDREPEAAGRLVVPRKGLRRRLEPLAYRAAVPYAPWMAGARVIVRREAIGCAGSRRVLPPLRAGAIPEPRRPHLSFILPADEPVKHRTGRVVAAVHFPQGRSVLLPGFADNARALARMDSLTRRIAEGGRTLVDTVNLRGYASPEDTYAYNTRLATDRVRRIADYLVGQHGIPRGRLHTSTVPEDWDSLRRWVDASGLPARARVLEIIDGIPQPDGRDAPIRAIDAGRTYAFLLATVYPGLRRVDYRIDYRAPACTDEELEGEWRRHPERLSLGEFCRLAARYPEASDERWAVCVSALEYFPAEPVAAANMASTALSRGDYALARHCLEPFATTEAVTGNPLGVVCLHTGDRGAARCAFERAAAAGDGAARYNLRWIDELEPEMTEHTFTIIQQPPK